MKIIEPGRGHPVEARCTGRGNGGSGCGALLGADRADLRYYAGGGTLERDPAVMMRCPACGTITDIPPKAWPSGATELNPLTAPWAKGERDGHDGPTIVKRDPARDTRDLSRVFVTRDPHEVACVAADALEALGSKWDNLLCATVAPEHFERAGTMLSAAAGIITALRKIT